VGGGEKKTLRLVAKYADACNLSAVLGDDVLRSKLDILKAHWRGSQGGIIAAIEKPALTLSPGARQATAHDVIEECRRLASLGIQHVIFNMPNVQDITPLEIFGREIIPAVTMF